MILEGSLYFYTQPANQNTLLYIPILDILTYFPNGLTLEEAFYKSTRFKGT